MPRAEGDSMAPSRVDIALVSTTPLAPLKDGHHELSALLEASELSRGTALLASTAIAALEKSLPNPAWLALEERVPNHLPLS